MYQPKVNHAIRTVYDTEHYEKWIKEKGYDRTTSAQLEYLDMVNCDPVLKSKYMPMEIARANDTLANNLGSNWRDFYEYDYETGKGKYKEGYSAKDKGGFLTYVEDQEAKGKSVSSLNRDPDRFKDYRRK